MTSENVPPQAPVARTAPRSESRWDWVLCGLLVVVLAAYYGLLQNGQWTPVSDSDGYIAVARNIALGKGMRFNGYAARRMPPGWPYVLAAAMKVSGSFRFLNLLPMAMFLGAMALGYRVVRRLARPRTAFAVVLASGIISWQYHLTYTLHSEGLFCLVCAAAVLLALQVAEGRAIVWRLPVLLVLCIVAVASRWPGVLACLVVVAALLRGRAVPRLNRQWVSAAAALALGVGVFCLVWFGVKGGWFAGPGGPPPRPAAAAPLQQARRPARRAPGNGPGSIVATAYSLGLGEGPAAYVRNVLGAGGWVTGLFWEPAQLGRSVRPLGVLFNLCGWALLALFLVSMVHLARRRDWLLVGVLAYALPLFARVGYPCPRYLLPFAPLVLFGIVYGIRKSARWPTNPTWRTAGRAAQVTLFAGIAVCNLALFAVDVRMLHADDFYGTYYAGQAGPLISAARRLRREEAGHWEVAINATYININLRRSNCFGLQGLHLLLNRCVLTVPARVHDGPPDQELARWLRARRVRYYVYRPPVEPWRVWHFRMPGLQEMATGRRPTRPNPYFELYELRDDRFARVSLPDGEWRVQRVPGLPSGGSP